MSYNLFVWEHPAGAPLPASPEEAGALVASLQRTGSRAGGNLVAFVRQLPPELGAAAADDSPVMVLGMPGADRLRFIRRTVDVAKAHRLTVLDDQLGLLFLPTGAVLPRDQAPLWGAVVEELDMSPKPLGKAEAEKLLRQHVGEVLAPHRFQPVKESRFHLDFARPVDGGVQRVQFWISGAGAELRCAVICKVTHERVAEIYDRFCGKNIPGGAEWSVMLTLPELLGEDPDATFPVANGAAVQALAATIARVVVPRLDEWTDIAGVDRVFNREARFPVMTHRFASLIVAALAGNPDFERLAEALRAAKASQGEELRAALERLIAFLRDLRPSPSSP